MQIITSINNNSAKHEANPASYLHFLDSLDQRAAYLASLQKDINSKLRKLPEGTLCACNSRGRTQYYYRKGPSDRKGTYLPKKNMDLAAKLAQKGYYQKISKAVAEELAAIRLWKQAYPSVPAEGVIDTLPQSRQSLIVPIKETDEQYVKKWAQVSYVGKSFAEDMTELITDRGERVRSKSELILSNLINGYSIPYKYECPLRLEGLGTVYPDFTVLNVRLRKEIIWEHFGMMDDPEYAEKAISKLMYYNLNGYYQGDRLIITAETKTCPINLRQVKEMIERMLI